MYQNGISPFTTSGYQMGVNLNWSITPKDELTGTLGYNHFENNASGMTLQNEISSLSDGTIYCRLTTKEIQQVIFRYVCSFCLCA